MTKPITGETCVHPIDGTVDPLTFVSLVNANVAAMGALDWAALLFATCIAALAVVGELKVRCVLCALSRFSKVRIFRSFCYAYGLASVGGATRILRCVPSQLRMPGNG